MECASLSTADVTGFGEKGPMPASLYPHHRDWARSGLLSMTRDADAPPTWPVAGATMRPPLASSGLSQRFIVVSAPARIRCHDVAARRGCLVGKRFDPGRAVRGKVLGRMTRKHPANAALSLYRASDGTWFVLIVTPDKLAAGKATGWMAISLDGSAFLDLAKLMQNMPQLAAILDGSPSARSR